MNALLRRLVIASASAGAAGCAVLPAVGLGLAAQGAQMVAVGTLGQAVAAQEQSNADRCAVLVGQGIAVSESLETTIPREEGNVETFERAFWRAEFASEGYPQIERSRTATEGALAIGERSVLFVPAPGATRIGIPYGLVDEVTLRSSAATGKPDALVVKSCGGRFDIVAFRQPLRDAPDTDTTVAATTRLKARLAKSRGTAVE